ncbi:MAG: GDP-mannose 4,6-dehydratase [Gammaproteobacteria bacterium]|nr:GDP-mannose 4,6-dehydratase [Gammaproteobacteria bacterium]
MCPQLHARLSRRATSSPRAARSRIARALQCPAARLRPLPEAITSARQRFGASTPWRRLCSSRGLGTSDQFDPVQTTGTSVHGAINMLGTASGSGVPILQASTSEVYGDPESIPSTESLGSISGPGPRSCCDEGKRLRRNLFFDYQSRAVLRTREAGFRAGRLFSSTTARHTSASLPLRDVGGAGVLTATPFSRNRLFQNRARQGDAGLGAGLR